MMYQRLRLSNEKHKQDVSLSDIYMVSSFSLILCSQPHNRLHLSLHAMSSHLISKQEINTVLIIVSNVMPVKTQTIKMLMEGNTFSTVDGSLPEKEQTVTLL